MSAATGQPRRNDASPAQLSRRDLLSGGLLLGLGALAGCQPAARSAGDLPGPITQGYAPQSPVPPTPAAPTPVAPSPVPVAGVQILPRSAWTSAGIAPGRRVKPLGQVLRITVHHEGATVFTSTDQGDASRRLASIRQSHIGRMTDGEEWADIGYHYVIDPSGRVWEGRSLQYQGAHVHLQNENNLGIMMLGNYEKQTPNRAQLATLDAFVASRMRQYRVPVSRVYTHREIGQSACPGESLQRCMVAARSVGGALRNA